MVGEWISLLCCLCGKKNILPEWTYACVYELFVLSIQYEQKWHRLFNENSKLIREFLASLETDREINYSERSEKYHILESEHHTNSELEGFSEITEEQIDSNAEFSLRKTEQNGKRIYYVKMYAQNPGMLLSIYPV